MKGKFLAILIMSSLSTTLTLPTFATGLPEKFSKTALTSIIEGEEAKTIDEALLDAYQTVCEAYATLDITADISLDDFISQYDETIYDSPKDYANAYIDLMSSNTNKSCRPATLRSSSNNDDKWYYNTGTTLPKALTYDQYNLLNTVKKGDIVFEAKGGHGITAHTAIVEGTFYDPTYEQYYIRLVEAISPDGVCRGVLDDERVDLRDVTIYRVNDATDTQCEAAVEFAVGELGSSYNLDFGKDSSADETDWYCSELVWAAYINQGIDIEAAIGEPGVTPRDIGPYSDATTSIEYQGM